ncbi:RING finger protein [Zancudomyces culisetae]|uniref:RING finger protein n=1 Tax=Zancudomyces culisetae TaxID=1213189 RepID=A0A1R1PHU8_ZANCU|nr:RING finger protein [Zancudomyces culisetae]|eukprot:OMH80554.1 RING finger protein [Zancudomyces culisetae]
MAAAAFIIIAQLFVLFSILLRGYLVFRQGRRNRANGARHQELTPVETTSTQRDELPKYISEKLEGDHGTCSEYEPTPKLVTDRELQCFRIVTYENIIKPEKAVCKPPKYFNSTVNVNNDYSSNNLQVLLIPNDSGMVKQDPNNATMHIDMENNSDTPIYYENFHNCKLCNGGLFSSDLVRDLPCKHTFHQNCVDWYLNNVSKMCPVCKIDLKYEANMVVNLQHPKV